MSSEWCTIESDPGVFTSLIESFGVVHGQLTELWSLDDDSLNGLLDSYGRVHGLIFLFKWGNDSSVKSTDESNGSAGGNGGDGGDGDGNGNGNGNGNGEIPEDLFFARQVTTNACATQAILSILLNATTGTSSSDNETGSNLILGETLTNLKQFTQSFPSDGLLKGETIGASEEIRLAHNAFARKESFWMDSDKPKRFAGKDDDVFHFVAYVPHKNGTVYELDGLQPGPIPVGTYTTETDNNTDFPWLSIARTAVQQRIEKYQSSEIKFNLMALTADRRTILQSKIQSTLSTGVSPEDEMVTALKLQLESEEALRESWKEENERRRHNYLPFCVELLKALGKSGSLQSCTKKANEKVMAQRAQKMRAAGGNGAF